MSSAIDICNLALSHLGDVASVSSIDPPEGSAQAEHCARFYPIARDLLLEAHDWNFATRRIAPALLVSTVGPWFYAYAKPNLAKKVIAVVPPSPDNVVPVTSALSNYDPYEGLTEASQEPQPYAIETLSTGEEVICTNQAEAVVRYTVVVTDPTKFSALFTVTLSWLLASMLAGPLIKGDVGQAEAKRCLGMFKAFLAEATTADAGQGKTNVSHIPPWLVR
jgi:hypothetical protein